VQIRNSRNIRELKKAPNNTSSYYWLELKMKFCTFNNHPAGLALLKLRQGAGDRKEDRKLAQVISAIRSPKCEMTINVQLNSDEFH